MSELDRYPDSYKTGSTNPPKPHRSLLAWVMAATILLIGLYSVFGLLNIRPLLHPVQIPATEPLSFSLEPSEANAAPHWKKQTMVAPLYLLGEDVSELYRKLYDLPRGFFVDRAVGPSRGLFHPADIIVEIDGVRICSVNDIYDHLNHCLEPACTVTVFRSGTFQTITVQKAG